MSWVQQPTMSATANQQQQHQHQTTPESHGPYQQQQMQHLQHQHGSTFASKTALSQMPAPPVSLPNTALNNVNSHLQNQMQQSTATHFNPPPPPQMSQYKTQQQQQLPQQVSQQQQLNTWQQQQNYQQNFNSMMQPPTANTNNWPQQPPASMGQHAQNTTFQQNTTTWSQQMQPHTTSYENYFAQDQNKPQQEQAQLQHYQQNDLNATATTTHQQQTATQQQLQQQPQQKQYNYNDFYDNSNNSANNNANNKSNEGWGDWGDWNDNNVETKEQAILEQTQLQQPNVIEDSFNTQNNANNNNQSWQWNVQENISATQQVASATASIAQPTAPQMPANQTFIAKQTNLPQKSLALQQNPSSINQPQQTADFTVVTSKAATAVSSVKPPNTLPLNVFKSETTTACDPSTTTNIPNSVYVSQAKPVTRPSRQFASPPTGNTPIESPENSLLLPQPPQAFQNETTAQQSMPAAPPKAASAMPPPPPPLLSSAPSSTAAASNPFKRAGAVKHHRAELLPTNTASNFGVPPPPADFANTLTAISASTAHLEPDNSEVLHENQEVIEPPPPDFVGSSFMSINTEQEQAIAVPPSGSVALLNAERNQYMQTSQLSEHQDDEFNLEIDSLPPPGLSRLVLGEPELESTNQRLVTGTEQPSALGNVALASLNMEERHADGEDGSVEQAANVIPTLVGHAHRGASNVGAANITADRNLYEVPGESDLNNDRRIVPGVETSAESATTLPQVTQVRSDQREVELDGENLEDEQQPQTSLAAGASRNEPPLEGAAANGGKSTGQTVPEPLTESRHYDKHNSKSSTGRSQSNASTGNESDFEPLEQQQQKQQQHSQRYKNTRSTTQKHGAEVDRRTEKHRREKQRSAERSFGSEEASVEYSTDQEREKRRGYREGSARSDHGNDDRQRERQRKRDKRENLSGAERDHDRHYKSSAANVSSRNEYSRRSTRGHGARDAQREPRSDRDNENSHRRSNRHEKDLSRSERVDDGREPRDARDARDRRAPQRRGERDARGDYNTVERQRRRGDRNHQREYDEYRKQSSRNARDSDAEKDQQRYSRNAGSNQLPDPRYDSHMMFGYPNSSQYDPYKYYYETMARTNPQAYHEWYKKYYEQQKQLMAAMSAGQQAAGGVAASAENMSANATVGAGNSSLAATDGRESVHSGRSSAHNEKDRYTQAYISQANQYHQRHYQPNVQFHHSQQQLQQQHHHYHQQQQQQLNRSLNVAAAAYHSQNFVMNSTFLGDAASVASFGSYSRAGRMSAAHSVDNLSSISSTAFKALSGHYMGTAGNAKYASLDHYADSRSGQLSLRDGESVALEQHRSTPLQFASLHTLVSMSAGVMVTIKPRVSSKGHLSNIAKLQRLGINDASRQLYQSFPGPLVRGLTHKKTIIDFCEEQIRLGPTETTIYARQLTPKSVEKYRASYTLMWNLLILLLRQNGMVVGTDIAELLLKNQQQFPYQAGGGTQSTGHRRFQSISDDESSENSLEAAESKPASNDGADDEATKVKQDGQDEAKIEDNKNDESGPDSTPISTTVQLSEAEITEKFRNYLLYGNVNEALDWATDNNLWGHALFLASKVDRRSHANVMMKFANKLSLNDPLQTLYQLMSGRTPSSVTSVQDEKWGDWRPHLSMILSNTSQKPELDRKAITTLGDSLFNRGDLYAAHFCYLMAQVGFGRYQESAVHETSLQQNLPKLVLLGSSHYKNFRDFASNEGIMMTEIYEYACSLNDEKFSLVEFQPYKYLLATRLLDYGFNLKSLMYMEQISLHIARDPGRYEASFINKVFEIADRLKYFDPVLEKTLDDSQQLSAESTSATDLPNAMPQNFEEQKWLQTLRSIAMQYKLDYPVPTASYPSHDYTLQQQQQQQQNEQHQQDSNYLQNQINQEFAEINKQFSELNLQYTSSEPQSTTFYNPETMQQQQQQQTTNLEHTNHQAQDYSQYPSQTIYGDYGSPLTTQEQVSNVAGGAVATAEAATTEPYANYVAQQQQQQQQQQSQYYDPNTQQQQYDAYAQQNAAGYNDYWSQQQQQQQLGNENARPTISMPKSKTYDSDDENQKKQQHQQAAVSQAKKGANGTAGMQQNKNDGKNANKSTQQTNQNSGWFGGIWNKLSLKPKNQMILPDDKNPTIVWDAEKKRWVNTEGEETSEESLKPPPKMSDIIKQQPPQMVPQQIQQQQQQQPQMPQMPQQPQVPEAANQLQPMTVPLAASSPLTNYSAQAPIAAAATMPAANTAPKQPSLQSNMFKMQRNRTLKNAYVDVFNPSGAPMSKAAENVLAPALPPAAVPQSGFFVPDGSTTNEANAAYQQQQLPETPQFYNPNQFGGGGY